MKTVVRCPLSAGFPADVIMVKFPTGDDDTASKAWLMKLAEDLVRLGYSRHFRWTAFDRIKSAGRL